VGAADFDALVEDFVGALDTFKVVAHEKEQLLGALRPMKTDTSGKNSARERRCSLTTPYDGLPAVRRRAAPP
jgi:hypothetical protein